MTSQMLATQRRDRGACARKRTRAYDGGQRHDDADTLHHRRHRGIQRRDLEVDVVTSRL